MTTIENGLFSFKRGNGKYVLRNKAIVSLTYTVKLITCTNELVTVSTGQLPFINDTTEFALGKDGKYLIQINDTVVYFSQWDGSRQKIVKDVKRLLCDTCKGCLNGCHDGHKCLKHQELFNGIIVYANFIKPYSVAVPQQYNETIARFIQIAISNNHCYINREYCKQLFSTGVTGNSEHNQELFNYFVAIHYLAFYFYDKYSVDQTDTVAVNYINGLWDFAAIKRCLLNLGLCIGDLEDLFQEEIPDTNPIIVNSPVLYEGFVYDLVDAGVPVVDMGYLPIAYNLTDPTLTNFNKLIQNYSNNMYAPSKIVFLNAPTVGDLVYNDEVVVLGQEYSVNSQWVSNGNIQELVGNKLRYKPLLVNVPLTEPIDETIDYNIIDTNGNVTSASINIKLESTDIHVYDGYDTTFSQTLILTDNPNNSVILESENLKVLTKNLQGNSNDSKLFFRLKKLSVIGEVLISILSDGNYEPVLDNTWYPLVDDKLSNVIFRAPNQTENAVAVISYEIREGVAGDGNITRNNFVYVPIVATEVDFISGHISFIPDTEVTSIQDNRLIGRTSIDGISVEGVMRQEANITFDPITGTIPDITVFAGEKVIIFFTENLDV